MPLTTTCLGAFPKPAYVPIRDWFQIDLAEARYKSAVIDRWNEDPALDGRIDALSIEDCHAPNDLALFERFTQTTAIVGFIEIAASRIEPVDEIAARMRQVLSVLPPERLIAAPDCGLGFLGRDRAVAKLSNLVAAARSV